MKTISWITTMLIVVSVYAQELATDARRGAPGRRPGTPSEPIRGPRHP